MPCRALPRLLALLLCLSACATGAGLDADGADADLLPPPIDADVTPDVSAAESAITSA